MRHHMAQRFLQDIEENSKLGQRPLKFISGTSENSESKKNTILGPKSRFRRIFGFLTPPPPPDKNLRGHFTVFSYFLPYFGGKNTTDAARVA